MPVLVHLSFWVLVFHVELCVDCSVQWLVIVSYCQLDISSTMNVNGKENHKHGMRKTFFIWCWFFSSSFCAFLFPSHIFLLEMSNCQ